MSGATVSDGAVSEMVARFERAERTIKPSKPFIVGPRTLTYGALADTVRRLTALFRRWDLRPDDRAVIASDDDGAVVTLFMALIRNGITAVILNPQAPAPELQTLVRAADAKALIADAAVLACGGLELAARRDAAVLPIDPGRAGASAPLLARLTRALRSGSGGDGSTYPAILGALTPVNDLPADVPADAVAYILFTSGTTSRPKGVEITHRNLFAQMRTFVRHYGFDESTRLLNVLPLHHTDGLTQGAVVALTAGATLVRPLRFSVDALPRLLDAVYADRVTHFVTVPSVLALIANLGDEYRDSFATEDFRFVISTAAYLDENLWRRFEAGFRTRVVNVYGLTETVCEALYCGPDEATRKLGTIGKPIDCEARIVDENGRDAPPGTTGELVLRGDHIMRGYFRMPDETAAVIKDGWFYTGDLATVDAEGFYRIVGRRKNVIITGGVNVYPEDVNNVLRDLPGVLDAVTLGMADPAWGERVVSCVVPAPGHRLSVEGIAAGFLERASRDKLPLEVHVLDDLPRGPAGKVILEEVRAIVRGLHERRKPAAAEGGGNLEARVLATAAQIFKAPIESLSRSSRPGNTAGWNSLAHVEFLLALESGFRVRMTPQDIMAIESLGDALRVVQSKVAAA